MAGVDAAGAEPIQHRSVQDTEQLAPVDGDLRPAVASSQTPGFPPDWLPMLRVVDEFGGGDAHAIKIVEETKLGQFAHSMGLKDDANPQLLYADADS